MENACIKVLIENFGQELHFQSTKDSCIETLRMHLYLNALIVVMNLSGKAALKAIIKDATGKDCKNCMKWISKEILLDIVYLVELVIEDCLELLIYQ